MVHQSPERIPSSDAEPQIPDSVVSPLRLDTYDADTSPEIEGLLAEPPRWPAQWGAVIILCVIIAAVGFAWFLKFPDLVDASLTLTTAEAPVTLRAPNDGRLDTLLVADKALVVPDQEIAILQSSARPSDILQLRNWLAATTISLGVGGQLRQVDPPLGTLAVGPAQDAYVALLTRISEFNAVVLDTITSARLRVLDVQEHEQDRLGESFARAQQLADSQATLNRSAAARMRALRARGFATDAGVDSAELDYLQHQGFIVNAQANQRTAAARRAEIEATVLSVVQQRRDEIAARESALTAAIGEVRQQIRLWDEEYVIRAPFAGLVSFLSFVHTHDPVQRGQELFAVVPRNDDLRAEALLPQSGSGKVRRGQQARLSFASYSVRDVGYVEGIVQDVSLVPRDSVLLLRIALPRGLRTTYGIRLPFQQRMLGVAEIVTGETSIIRRITNRAKLIRDRHY